MATDPYQNVSPNRVTAPPRRAFAVSTSDSADLAFVTRSVYVGTAGDLQVTYADDTDGTSVTLPNLVAGVFHPMQVKRIWSANTTALNIVAVY